MFNNWRKNNKIHCCEKNNNNNTQGNTNLNSAFNQSQISCKMKYAQNIRIQSRGSKTVNNMSGGISNSSGVFYNISSYPLNHYIHL